MTSCFFFFVPEIFHKACAQTSEIFFEMLLALDSIQRYGYLFKVISQYIVD